MTGPYTREHFAAKLGANSDPKLNAAADFAARLLSGSGGDRVARIVLFGSVAGGVAEPNSDVDVMVFASLPRKRLSELAAEAAWEATVEWGEQVAPLTYPMSRLFYPHPYVVYDTLKRGWEIYATDEDKIRRQAAEGLLRKGKSLLRQAEHSLDSRNYELAIDGGYTAAEHGAKALLMLKPDVKMPHTHGGVAPMFAREYVRTGEVPADWSNLLQQKLDLRSRAMYDFQFEPQAEEAARVLEFATEMLDFLQQKLWAEGREEEQ